MRLTRTLLPAVCILASLAGCTAGGTDKESVSKGQPELRFTDGRFRILQLTDLHWKDDAANCDTTEATIRALVAAEKPGLIALTGDVVTYEPATAGWKHIVRILDSLEVPFTIGIGNHDAEYLTRDSIFTLAMASPYYVGDRGPAALHGRGNTLLPVIGADGKTAAMIYCLDSNDDPASEIYGPYDWIHFDQIQWYRQKSDSVTAAAGGTPVPSLMFFHIPLQEYAGVMGDPNTFGCAKEGAGASSAINSGLFASLLEQGDVMGVFVGHDHENDFVGLNRGIALGFGRCTGTQAYGDAHRGGRIIELREGGRQFDTWAVTPDGRDPAWHYPSALNDVMAAEMTYLPAIEHADTAHGVSYDYYEGLIKHTSQITDAMHRSSGTMPNFDITGAPVEDHFAYHFHTLIRIPERGVYRFHTYSDDGSTLAIDGKTVVDNDGGHSARLREGLVALEAGFHRLDLTYFENYMGQELKVGITSLDIPATEIPDSMLYLP